MEMMGWLPVHVQIVLNHLRWMPHQDRWFFRTILLLIPTWPKLVLIIQLIWLVWWKPAMKQLVTAGQISSLLIFTRYERVLLHYFRINLQEITFKAHKLKKECRIYTNFDGPFGAEEWWWRSSRSCGWSKWSTYLRMSQRCLLQGLL